MEREPVALLKAAPDRDKPSVQKVRERQITSFADWDRVGQVRSTIVAFENSNGHREAAIFADAMLRDDRINGVMSTRAGAVAGAYVSFQAATNKRRAQKIAEELQGSEDQAGKWETMVPASVLSELLMWGYFLGIAVAEIVWTLNETEWVPRLKMWHPQNLRWDSSMLCYLMDTETGTVKLPKVDENPRSDGKWVVWCPYSYRNGWRRAMMRPLAMLYLARQWTYRDWSRYNEKHGSPADKVFVPETANAQEKADFYATVANRGADSTFFLPRGAADAPGYDVEILEATGQSWQSFKEHIAKLETDVAIMVLGQNLTTEVQGGSFAATKEHGQVRLDKLREDAKIANVLRDQVLTWWAQFNHGDAALAPRPKFEIEPPADEKQEAETIAAVGNAIITLQAAQVPVDALAVATKAGVPLLPDDEQEAAGARGVELTPSSLGAILTVNEARDAKGMGPLMTPTGAPDPDGTLSVAEYTAKVQSRFEGGGGPFGRRAVPPGQEEPAPDQKEPDDDEDEPTAMNTTAREVFAALDALRGLQVDRTVALRAKRTVAGSKRAAGYADALMLRARKRAAAVMKPDLVALTSAIQAATSYDDLRERVITLYREKMTAKELAKTVEKVQILAHMSGRLGAVEDI